MLELATASVEARTVAQARLLPLIGSCDGGDDLMWQIRTGRIASRELKIDGKPEYIFYFAVTGRNYLEICASAFVGGGEPKTEFWVAGAERLKVEMKCDGIVFCTQRRGLVEIGLRNGYKIDGVLMSKK